MGDDADALKVRVRMARAPSRAALSDPHGARTHRSDTARERTDGQQRTCGQGGLPARPLTLRPARAPATAAQTVPFEVRGFSYATVTLGAATVLTLYSFFQFFLNDGEASSSLGFVYGFPGLLLGCALKYAEVPPAPIETGPGAEEARTSVANVNLQKIFADVTRFRYADEHMGDALKILGLQPRGEGPPELLKVTERVTNDGQYSMEMQFKCAGTPYTSWLKSAHRYANFFGPNVRATVKKVSAEQRIVALTLISVPPGGDETPREVQEDGTEVPIALDGSVETVAAA